MVTFTGDAGFWYHIGEIETAVRWNINAVTVVNNNASGNQSKRGFDRVYGGTQTEQASELWTFSKVNFARIATKTWARSESGWSSPAEIGPALAQALAADRPVVIDVVTDIDALAPLCGDLKIFEEKRAAIAIAGGLQDRGNGRAQRSGEIGFASTGAAERAP